MKQDLVPNLRGPATYSSTWPLSQPILGSAFPQIKRIPGPPARTHKLPLGHMAASSLVILHPPHPHPNAQHTHTHTHGYQQESSFDFYNNPDSSSYGSCPVLWELSDLPRIIQAGGKSTVPGILEFSPELFLLFPFDPPHPSTGTQGQICALTSQVSTLVCLQRQF